MFAVLALVCVLIVAVVIFYRRHSRSYDKLNTSYDLDEEESVMDI